MRAARCRRATYVSLGPALKDNAAITTPIRRAMRFQTACLLAAALVATACSSTTASKPSGSARAGSARAYSLTDTEKFGNALRLTFATSWPAIQCSAAIDGLKVGSGQGTSLAGVAKVSIYVPAKYEGRQASEFSIECSQF